ncbi:MAG: lipopolysaccharide kinase InaA family protein [Aeoliella sp.]
MAATDDTPTHESNDRVLYRRSLDRSMRWEKGLSRSVVEQIWQDPQALIADGQKLHEKLSCTVVRLERPTGLLVLKYQDSGNLIRRVRKSLSRSSARRSWAHGRFLLKAGIATPRPRALLERTVGPFKSACCILTDYIPGTTLYRLLRYERPDKEVFQDIARQLANIWQRLDELRLCHNDLKPENLLIDPKNKLWLIDLDRMLGDRQARRFRERQTQDIRDLLHPRCWRADPSVAEVFRRALLKAPATTTLLQENPAARRILSEPLPAENRSSQLVTVLIPCRNAADTIRACIESVRDMADEILVANAGSTDDTLDVVRRLGGCKIIQQQCRDAAAFETWAHSHVRHPWTLRVLPTEKLTPELARQVQDLLAPEPPEEGFLLSQAAHFRGNRLRYGGFEPHPSIRLYRTGVGRCELRGGRSVVEVPSGNIGQLRSRLIYDYCPNIHQLLNEMKERAAADADHGQRIGLRRKPPRIGWRAGWRFLQSYLLRSGWLDGQAGLDACLFSAIQSDLSQMMVWDPLRPGDSQPLDKPKLDRAA